MQRRVFLGLLTAFVSPCTPTALHAAEVRRVAVLVSSANDQEIRSYLSTFRDKLDESGWVEGHNVRFDVCCSDANSDSARACATKLVGFAPDVILSSGPESLSALRQTTGTIPIVFTLMGEPVDTGLVSSLARPAGNITGSSAFEYSIAGKWLELLHQIAPAISKVGVLSHSGVVTHPGYLNAIETAERSLKVHITVRNAGDAREIEVVIDSFAHDCDGLIVLPSPVVAVHRNSIISQANQHRLATVYPYRLYAANGGLLSYGSSVVEMFRQAAAQADKILRGARVADLPVQMASKFELVINLKTARTLGLTVPPALLARADEVIE
jgi:putative tryptophan/tyrosine transport system substrate-binding protein